MMWRSSIDGRWPAQENQNQHIFFVCLCALGAGQGGREKGLLSARHRQRPQRDGIDGAFAEQSLGIAALDQRRVFGERLFAAQLLPPARHRQDGAHQPGIARQIQLGQPLLSPGTSKSKTTKTQNTPHLHCKQPGFHLVVALCSKHKADAMTAAHAKGRMRHAPNRANLC